MMVSWLSLEYDQLKHGDNDQEDQCCQESQKTFNQKRVDCMSKNRDRNLPNNLIINLKNHCKTKKNQQSWDWCINLQI